jgi:hypothetical protein
VINRLNCTRHRESLTPAARHRACFRLSLTAGVWASPLGVIRTARRWSLAGIGDLSR